MSLVVITGGKGSPGVTTTAVALAAVWPQPVLLAECDPAGGDLPALLPGTNGVPLTASRGVVSLAAAARTDTFPTLDEHLQLVAGGLPVLAGAASAAQVAALAPSWPTVIDTLTGRDVDVIADCGRFAADDATARLVAAADVTVLVCRATVTSVAHAREVLAALGRRGDSSRPPQALVALVVVGSPGEVREVGMALAAHSPVFVAGLDHDPAAAAGLCGAWSRRLDRSRLIVAARVLARQIGNTLATDTTANRATPPAAIAPEPVPISVAAVR